MKYFEKFALLSDRLLSEKNIELLGKFTILQAILALFVHAFVIFLVSQGFIDLRSIQPNNYLQAISTPFTFILIYELFLLVVSIKKSINEYVGKQLELISLIIIRDAFKTIGDIGELSKFTENEFLITNLIVKIFAALIIFLLVLVYKNIQVKLSKLDLDDKRYYKLQIYEKSTALVTTALFFVVIISNIFSMNLGLENFFIFRGFGLDQMLLGIFTIMIFADVFILLLYFMFNESYETVFRNSVFIISTIILRLSLTVDPILDKALAVFGVVLVVVTMYIYYRNVCYKQDLK